MTSEPSSLLTEFYLGVGTDHAGRTISAIHRFDFRELERIHDYIQWLFPLVTRSRFNEWAPILTEEDRMVFHRDPLVRRNFHISLELMWGFYGFKSADNGKLHCMESWEERCDSWLTRDNHNLLRITRVLRSSMLCGFIPEAQAFLDAVMKASADRPGVTGRSEEFWKTAVATVPSPPDSN